MPAGDLTLVGMGKPLESERGHALIFQKEVTLVFRRSGKDCAVTVLGCIRSGRSSFLARLIALYKAEPFRNDRKQFTKWQLWRKEQHHAWCLALIDVRAKCAQYSFTPVLLRYAQPLFYRTAPCRSADATRRNRLTYGVSNFVSILQNFTCSLHSIFSVPCIIYQSHCIPYFSTNGVSIFHAQNEPGRMTAAF